MLMPSGSSWWPDNSDSASWTSESERCPECLHKKWGHDERGCNYYDVISESTIICECREPLEDERERSTSVSMF